MPHKFHIKAYHFAELRKFIEGESAIDQVADAMREIIEREMPDLAHKLPPKTEPAKARSKRR
jgi:hypothetical protein